MVRAMKARFQIHLFFTERLDAVPGLDQQRRQVAVIHRVLLERGDDPLWFHLHVVHDRLLGQQLGSLLRTFHDLNVQDNVLADLPQDLATPRRCAS